ncbi:MAG: NOL1/NOP2/sun family putative RNA methylase [Desulfatiglandales bacterium]
MNDPFEKYREFIPDFKAFRDCIKDSPAVHLRINELKVDPSSAREMLEEEGILLQRSSVDSDTLFFAPELQSPGNILEYFLGYIHPQALTSCLVSLVLSPTPDSFVLDLCASPGGKTAHTAQLMNNTGLIVANELYRDRHIPLGNTLNRLGVLNTVITAYQAQEFPLRERFDFVLADVPCSGEGRFRMNRKDHFYRGVLEEARLQDIQKRIILRGFDLLGPGGVMVYATCTYNPVENESVVDFLLKNREAELLPIDIGFPCDPGIRKWKNETYESEIQRSIRLYPHRINSVGFYMARIGRGE